jgi:hypothetical protein
MWIEVKRSEVVKWSEVRWSEVNWNKAKRSEVKRSEVVNWSEVKRSEVKWSEVKTESGWEDFKVCSNASIILTCSYELQEFNKTDCQSQPPSTLTLLHVPICIHRCKYNIYILGPTKNSMTKRRHCMTCRRWVEDEKCIQNYGLKTFFCFFIEILGNPELYCN